MRQWILILVLFSTVSLSAQHRNAWAPDHLVLQYAGSIGYLSGGAGYNVFKGKARASAHFGHVPKSVGGPLNVFTAKLMFVPLQYRISNRTVINPVDAGLMVSYHLGKNFNSRWPDQQYPENYYWWKTSLKFHLNIESSITVHVRDHTMFKAITGYIEINSNELYMVSISQNRHSLSLGDVVKLGAGARFHF